MNLLFEKKGFKVAKGNSVFDKEKKIRKDLQETEEANEDGGSIEQWSE